MARIRTVPAGELSSRSLRAQDYVYSPEHHAKALLDTWRKMHDPNGLINPKGKAYKALKDMLVHGLAHANVQPKGVP